MKDRKFSVFVAGETEDYWALQSHISHYSACLYEIALVIKECGKEPEVRGEFGGGVEVVVWVTAEEELRKTTATAKPTEKPSEFTCHSPTIV